MKNRTATALVTIIFAGEALLLAFTRFTAWPEMTLWPYLMLNSWLPYQDIAIAHTPLLLLELSIWYAILGIGVLQLKFFTWAIILSTGIIVYKISEARSINKYLALVVYFLLNFIYDGNGLWFDLVLGLMAVLVYWSLNIKKYKWAGVLSALMFFTKQTAFWFAPVVLYNLLHPKEKRIALRNFVIGMLTVGVCMFIVLLLNGILDDFWRWAINFGIFVLPRANGQIQLPGLKTFIISILPVSVVLMPIIFKPRKWELTSWALLGLLGAFPRFELFHFQPALPFIALVAAGLTKSSSKKKMTAFILALYTVVLLIFAFAKLINDFGKPDRFAETDVIQVSEYVNGLTLTDEDIYIINDWDNIYAYSQTLPATRPWVPHLSWYINLPGVEEEIVKDLIQEKPRIIVQRQFEETGLGSYEPPLITSFIRLNYNYLTTIDGHIILTRK